MLDTGLGHKPRGCCRWVRKQHNTIASDPPPQRIICIIDTDQIDRLVVNYLGLPKGGVGCFGKSLAQCWMDGHRAGDIL